jgi:hypothetical protein
MSGSDRPESALNDGPGTALMPLAAFAQRSHDPRRRWSPNPVFVTHLIATAEQVAQTRRVRRASFADAQAAYRASQGPLRDAGTRTRQVV